MLEPRSFSEEERRTMDLATRVQGWGADLDPAVRPGVPMDPNPYMGAEKLYPSGIEQQVPYVKIHCSTEHMKLTPVFGTSCPPKGLSGLIRDQAYHYSEGRFAHWLMLMFADRVDVVEHLFLDLMSGTVPNVWKEMGLQSELKYNRKNFQKNCAMLGAGLLAVTLAGYWVQNKRANRMLSV